MNFKKLTDKAKCPTIHNNYSPALELYCQDSWTLPMDTTTVVPLGIRIDLTPEDTDRLGKQGAFMIDLPHWFFPYGLTSFGTTIFSLDYVNEWTIVLSNQGKQNVSFEKHQVIAMALWFEHGLTHPMFDPLRKEKTLVEGNGTGNEIRDDSRT